MTSEAPWLSIIVPVFNAKKYLKQCVNSILAQSFADFELLLIDDGSTDGSEAICRKYAEADSRVRYFRKENGGCFQSRLYGMERARGTYILTCDADDYYLTKDAFSILREAAERYDPEVLQFGCRLRYRLQTRDRKNVTEITALGREAFSAQEYPMLLCTDWPGSRVTFNVWSKLYHRSLLSKLPPADTAERFFHGEDIVLNLHLLENVRSFLFLPELLYVYRKNGATSRFLPSELTSMDITRNYQLRFWDRWNDSENKEHVLCKIHTSTAYKLYRFAVKGEQAVGGEELKRLLQEALALPMVRLARQYFLDRPDENDWWLFNLLREADPARYMEQAREENRRHRMKKWVRAVLLNN